MKMSTKQAIRQALKKNKGKKSNKSKGIDTTLVDKQNKNHMLDGNQGIGREKPTVNDNATVCYDSEYNNMADDFLMVSGSKEDLLQPLSVKEQRFLGLYLIGDHTQEQAMKLAGYEQKNVKHLYILARKILLRYECQTGDHRKIMRTLGWGEVRVLQSLIEAATKFNSETVRLNARESLAKCLGIQKEVLEQAEGIQIVINQGCAPADDQPAALTLEPQDAAPPPPARPLTITK